MRQIAIIGGGLTGLSAAYYLGKEKPEWQIDVYEKDAYWGGKIQTKKVDGYMVELGPDSYLGRKTEMTDLIHQLGLGNTLVSNATGQAYVYDRGAVHPIPGGSIMGIPTEVMPFVKASLISWPGKIRAGFDIFKGPYPVDANGDVSIGDFFLYHLGQEMMDKLIEPLLSGIYGGDIYKISILSTFPHFLQVEQKYGNMLKGMLAAKLAHTKKGVVPGAPGSEPGKKMGEPQNGESHDHSGYKAPTRDEKTTHSRRDQSLQTGMFRQFKGGLASVIDAILEQMPDNVHLHANAYVENLTKEMAEDDRETYIFWVNGEKKVAHEVVICTPPRAYKEWFKEDAAFDCLRQMDQTSCAIAIMAFDKKTFDGNIKGSGLLVTRKTDTPITACTNISEKWPQTTPSDKIVLRVFIGKPKDNTVVTHETDDLQKIAVKEIQRILGFTTEPLWVELNRIVGGMPQYYVGHRAHVKDLRAHITKEYPYLHLIGTPFDGIGIPDGVKQAKELVQMIVHRQ